MMKKKKKKGNDTMKCGKKDEHILLYLQSNG